MTPEAGLACCRFALDAAAMMLWGAFAYLALLVPANLRRVVARRLAAARIAAVATAAGATLAALPVESAALGNGWPDAIDGAALQAVLFDTGVGAAWRMQVAAAAVLVAATALPDRVRSSATAVAAGLVLATLTLTGHAAMQDGWPGLAHQVNDVVHVLAAGAWLGALVPLLPILGALGQPALRPQAGVALRRFSAAGHGAVAVALATGAVNTALTLGGAPVDWSSPYQALLAAKIALVAVMVALAVGNRYIVLSRMRGRRERTPRVMRATTLAEIVLGVMAIACVSIFGLLEPS